MEGSGECLDCSWDSRHCVYCEQIHTGTQHNRDNVMPKRKDWESRKHWAWKRAKIKETWVQSLGWENPLEKEMTIHSTIPAWKTPWTGEPGRLQSMGLQESNVTEWLTH